ncbi:MAG: S9 family peptidase, partial [Deinococcota bacterium]|nr:S9 family peptidase [Deinococcota bacterium]
MAKKIKADSLLELSFISDPQIRPDGKASVAVRTDIEAATDASDEDDKPAEYKSRIYLFDHSGGEPRAFTQPSSTHPRWSPDGSQLAFLSSRDEKTDKPQLFVMPVFGGEAERRTEFKDGVKDFAWNPEGERIAFISRG